MSNDRRQIGTGTYSTLSETFFRRTAFKERLEAKKSGRPVSPEVKLVAGCEGCTLFGLTDPSGHIFAIKAEVSISHNSQILYSQTKSALLDFGRLKATIA